MAVPFGIEEEFFVMHGSGRAPATDEIDALFIKLCELGCRGVGGSALGVPGGAVFEADGRAAVIKTEHCTHVLEIAFPPLTCPLEFCELWKQVFGLLTAAMDWLGLRIQAGSVLGEVPSHHVRPNENDPGGARQRRLIERPSTGSELFVAELFAVICSTQVSLGAAWQGVAANLESYYALEYLFPLLYSRGSRFGEQQAHSIRPLIMQANFTAEFGQVGFPADVRQSVAENEMGATVGRRSYAYIARRENRVEFRSADCQGDVDRVLEIAALRLLIHELVKGGYREPDIDSSRNRFFDACHAKTQTLLSKQQQRMLRTKQSLLDSNWRNWILRAIEKLQD